jgi:ATP-binding cassette subfamily F protein uup
MALISLKDVSLSFGHPPLLTRINLQIEAGERVCLVGRNGSGKTTIMKMLEGAVQPDEGEIIRGTGLRVAAMAQSVPGDINGSVRAVIAAALPGWNTPADTASDHRADEIISRLSLPADAAVSTLSGGQRRRVMLGRALAAEPDILLLDEPTNHLDLAAIAWMENFLLRFKGTVLFVTHDRMFLRRLATRIIDLDNGTLTSWPGDYDSYLEKKQAWLENEARQFEKFDRRLAEEEVWIRKGIKARRTRNEGRVRNLIQMRQQAKARRKRTGDVKITVQESGRTGKRVVQMESATFAFDTGEAIIKDLSVSVFRGDRIGIIGPNGCGKTTLVRLLLRELCPQSGTVTPGENMAVAYLDQLRDHLDPERTVAENLLPDGGDSVLVNGSSRHVLSWLGDFLFTPDRARTPVWVLSGGERNRLLLAKLFTRPCNVLVFDEPTNDLDMETLELLEERIADFNGTVILVSHDRAFLNNTVTSTLVFESDGRIAEYAGGYDDWLAQRPADPSPDEGESGRRQSTPPREKPAQRNKLTYNEKREREALPQRIRALEEEHAELEAQLNDPAFFVNNDEAVRRVTARIGPLEEEILSAWERLDALKDRNA